MIWSIGQCVSYAAVAKCGKREEKIEVGKR